MITYQDYLNKGSEDVTAFIMRAIDEHTHNPEYKIACEADLYDAQKNKTINEYVQTIMTLTGYSLENYTVSNNKIASNLFRRLNTQRCMYSLGNGLTFSDKAFKLMLGDSFDTDFKNLAYKGLIHGVSFGFWDLDKLYIFPITEFVPLYDEYDGALKAGIRFWRLADNKPLTAVFYEIDGYTKYQTEQNSSKLVEVQAKTAYKVHTQYSLASGDEEIIGYENYTYLPIIPFFGSNLHQSTLVGLKSAIDSYDIIRSGFANDLTDCSQIYWIIKNCGGMTDNDLNKVRDRLMFMHILNTPSDEGSIEPYTQEIPYQARQTYLELIKAGIYEDFGALDVHTISAGATNDHIDAAYQPLDENADDFEYQCIAWFEQFCNLLDMGIQVPEFKRNRISNQKEQVEMLAMEAAWLDEETILKKLPNVTVDEISDILKRKDAEDMERFSSGYSTEIDESVQINENATETPVD